MHGLIIETFDYNNVILDMLCAPNYGLAIPSLQYINWENAIANAVIDNIKEKNGVYIPANLQKSIVSS